MKFISKINTTTKILILVIYTFLLLAIAGCVVIKSTKEKDHWEYTEQAFDENLEVGVSMLESRTRSSEEDENSRETSKWSVRVHLNARDTSKKFKNVSVYLTIKTKDGTYIYKEKNTKKEVSMPSINYLSEYSLATKTQKYDSETKTFKNTDNSPVQAFLKVHYQVSVTKLSGDTEYKDYEINYKFDVINFNEKDINKYQHTTVDDRSNDNKSKRIDLKDDNKLFGLNIITKLGDNKYDKFNIYTYYSKETIGKAGIEVKDSHLAVFGKLDNDPHDDTNYMSDYVSMVQYHGILTTRSVGISLTSSTVSYNELYNLSDIYIMSIMKTVPGKTISSYVTIPVKELPVVE